MIDRLEGVLRKLRSRVSRSEWSVRRLGLPLSEQTETEPGLVMIRVAGLTHDVFRDAIRSGRMPFCRRLLQVEGYRLHELDSGNADEARAHEELFFRGEKGLLRGGSNYAGLCGAGASESHFCNVAD